jgi:hypothetical protein
MSGTRKRGLVVLAAGGALALVAIAAGGATPVGTGGARAPSEWLLDVVVSLLLVQMAFGAVLLVVLLLLRPQELVDPRSGPPGRRGRAALVGIAALLLLLVVVAARRVITGDGDGLSGLFGQGTSEAPGDGAPERYEPEFATVPVLLVAVLVSVAVCAWLLAARARRVTAEPDDALQVALLAALDDSLDDLEAEPDPRRAVIAAYARLEHVLAAYGAPRRSSEAPDEYLRRVLASLELSRTSVSRLTALFQAAKFSQHDVDADMKRDAIDALARARDELRLARERAEAERLAALERADRADRAPA